MIDTPTVSRIQPPLLASGERFHINLRASLPLPLLHTLVEGPGEEAPFSAFNFLLSAFLAARL
jgi:hypothetical protein